jgi:hypothetical protein
VVLNDSIAPLNCRGGCYFFLDKKVTKKSSQQKCFFALPAFALQIWQNHGLQNIALLLSLKADTRQNLLCPFQCSRPPLFCLILAEAVLLTGK